MSPAAARDDDQHRQAEAGEAASLRAAGENGPRAAEVLTRGVVHRLRAISVELDLARAEFARANGLHDTDVRALICLLDAERAGIAATAGWLGAQLGLEPSWA